VIDKGVACSCTCLLSPPGPAQSVLDYWPPAAIIKRVEINALHSCIILVYNRKAPNWPEIALQARRTARRGKASVPGRSLRSPRSHPVGIRDRLGLTTTSPRERWFITDRFAKL